MSAQLKSLLLCTVVATLAPATLPARLPSGEIDGASLMALASTTATEGSARMETLG